MWILALLCQISLSTHSEYRLYADSLSEHLESYGSINYRKNNINLLADYILEDNMNEGKMKYAFYPSISAEGAHTHLIIGYFQKSLISGLLLNQMHDMQFKRFRYLKGIYGELKTQKISVGLFSATPRELLFSGSTYITTEDTQSILRGFVLGGNSESFSGSLSYMRLNRSNMPAPFAFSEEVGGEFNIQKGQYSLTLDAGIRRGVDYITYTRVKGSGVFLSLEYMPSFFNILLQLARYEKMNFYNLNLPPVPLKTEILPSAGNDEKGGSVTLFFPVNGGSIEMGTGGLYSLSETNFLSPSLEKSFQEAYLQSDIYRGVSIFNIKTGYEKRLRIEPEYTHLKDLYLSLDCDLQNQISAEFFTRIDKFKEDSMSYYGFTGNISYYVSENINLQFLFEHVTHKIVRYDFENTWPSVGVSFTENGGNISVFYGKQKGGLVCSGGMCRLAPKFNGFKIIFEKSF